MTYGCNPLGRCKPPLCPDCPDLDEGQAMPLDIEALAREVTPMTINIQALAIEAGIEDREPGEQWEDDQDLRVAGREGVSLPFLRAYTNAVLEAAARECERPRLGGSEPVQAFELAEAIRALKVTP